MAVSPGERVEASANAEPEAAHATPAAAMGPTSLAQAMLALQRTHGNRAVAQIARTITFDECDSDQEDRVMRAHRRAKSMIKRAIKKLGDYDGTDPAEVHSALSKHFSSTSTTTAWFVQTNFENLLSEMDWSLDPQYQCNAEQDGSTLAWVPWCVWGADIQVYPLFFTKRDGTERSLNKQASTLVHEWFHKYGCKLDVGYAHEEGYGEHSTLRQLVNSDSFGEFAYDVY